MKACANCGRQILHRGRYCKREDDERCFKEWQNARQRKHREKNPTPSPRTATLPSKRGGKAGDIGRITVAPLSDLAQSGTNEKPDASPRPRDYIPVDPNPDSHFYFYSNPNAGSRRKDGEVVGKPTPSIGQRRLKDLEELVNEGPPEFEVADGRYIVHIDRLDTKPTTVEGLWQELRRRLVLVGDGSVAGYDRARPRPTSRWRTRPGAKTQAHRRGVKARYSGRRPSAADVSNLDMRWERCENNEERGWVIREAILILSMEHRSRMRWRQPLLENAKKHVRHQPEAVRFAVKPKAVLLDEVVAA